MNENPPRPNPLPKVKQERIIIPTGNRRHMTAIREGKVSGEIFCRDARRRRELGLPVIPVPEDYDFIGELRS